MSDASPSGDLAKLRELLADTRICMLTTVDHDGAPWSRPMALQGGDVDGELWFFSNAGEPKIEHIERNARVGVAVSRPGESEYVTLAGTASVHHDPAQAEALWSEPARAWFPDGPTSPDLRLIRVDVDRAEYWDSPSGALVMLWGYAKAVLTGEASHGELTETGQVDL